MCGIIGYIGKGNVKDILVEGLKRLEYRGYDSSGIAVINRGRIICVKAVGNISRLEEKIRGKKIPGNIGIAHTRWATHGSPVLKNAHPHMDSRNRIAVVHNGIIENFQYLRSKLIKKGIKFRSDTDSEILAHLISQNFKGNLSEAVRNSLKQVEGTYGIAVICSENPGEIVAAKKGSPLIVAVGKDEMFVTSDLSATLRHTKKIISLEDNEMAIIRPDNYEIKDIENVPVLKKIEEVSWNIDMIEKGGYKHFMLKEIHEQPESITNSMRGRIDEALSSSRLGGLLVFGNKLKKVEKIIISACGTSWHAGLIGEYMIEDLARIPVEVEYASEFRYRNPILNEKTLIIAVSQSGETADTLAAMREAKMKNSIIMGICNVVGSSIARESDGGIYLHAGPEIGVASTKAFTSQVTVLLLLALHFGRMKDLSKSKSKEIIDELKTIPSKVETILKEENKIKKLAELYFNKNNFLYLGRGYNFPTALEGALKLKEISYIHAEGYPAAEMKHGPIALIDKDMPVVVIATSDTVYDKIISNIQEIKARDGKVIAIVNKGDTKIKKLADYVISIPKTMEILSPLLTIIPMQLLAYHIAAKRGCNVDQPRNLAKSVTVE
ncbi:glutamine--fructose-6-phosphate transaminase (isomerizing) [bacterium]|jgi:glucosamine--fructose-6-phosphate aminotransferase (isomerizing)|nr:glutamine--fructose-6-phosphate transaminase (isomerizing) [bacterium]